MDGNYLRKLLAMGVDPRDLGMGQDEMSGGYMEQPMPQNALAEILRQSGARGNDAMVAPQAYDMSGNEASTVNGDFQVYAGEGRSQNIDLNAPRQGQSGMGLPASQPSGAQQGLQRMRVKGIGNNGMVSDLGEREMAAPQIDYSRPGIEIAGQGKGLYGKDGKVYIKGPDGQLTQVNQGYDAMGSWQAFQRDFQKRKGEQDLQKGTVDMEHTRAQTEHARAQMQPKPIQPVFNAEAGGWVYPPSADAPGGRVLAPDGFEGKAPNEGQGKAATFGTRMAQSHEVLNSVGQDGKVQPSLIKRAAEEVPLIDGALGMAANAAASPAQQQVEQAQRNFINAVLRRESGAVISPSEFSNAALQYFPQPNDDSKVIAQKRASREEAIKQMAVEAGPRAGKSLMDSWGKAKAPQASPAPPPQQRQVNQVYQTPKGPLRWVGNGWATP